MITIDLRVFLPYSQSLDKFITNVVYMHCRPIFTEHYLIHQGLNLCTNIVWLYTHISYSSYNLYVP